MSTLRTASALLAAAALLVACETTRVGESSTSSQPRATASQFKHAFADQGIVEHHRGRSDQPFGLAREQFGIAGSSADQPDHPGEEIGVRLIARH